MLKQDISRLFRKGNEYLGHLLGTFMSWSRVHAAVEQNDRVLCRAHYQRGQRKRDGCHNGYEQKTLKTTWEAYQGLVFILAGL